MSQPEPDTYEKIMADAAARIRALPEERCRLCDLPIKPGQKRRDAHMPGGRRWMHADYQECES